MASEKQAQFVRLYDRANEAANALHAQAAEVHKMGKDVEEHTEETTLWYAGLRVHVEARAVREQAEALRRALEEMGEGLRGGA